jgi:hypothetical protein
VFKLVVLRHGVLRGANVRVPVVQADRDIMAGRAGKSNLAAKKKASEEACMLSIVL